jgi:transcriptional regulator with XRE-family HTH domain
MAIVSRSRHPRRMQDLKKKLGDCLRSGRLNTGLTQEGLADIVGVTVETISNSERGESLVTLPVFLGLAAALELDLTEFVSAVPSKRRKVAPKRLRTEGELRQLAEQLNDAELNLLVGIARLMKPGRGQ